MKCNVVCVQTYPKLCDKVTNLQTMKGLMEKALKEYPLTDLVIFPELCTTGYQCGEEFYALSERAELNSYSVSFMAELAKEYGVHVIYGFPEADMSRDNKIYNSQLFLDNKGEIIGVYRKVHLFDSEKQWFTPGDEFKVFDTKIGKIGLFICYDAFFPEAARSMAVKGVDLLVNSTNWEKPYSYDMDMAMTARALENTVYLACCNRIGADTTLDFFGHTRILDPLGQPIAAIYDEVEGYIYASLDYDRAEEMKKSYYTMLTERRPELYKTLTQ